MKTTNIFSSKTFWVNAVAAVSFILALAMGSSLPISADGYKWIGFALAALNGIMRIFTGTPITGSPADPTK